MSEHESQIMEREAFSTLDRAQELAVTCDEEYSFAGEFVMGCKTLIAKINGAHAGNIARWHQGHVDAIADRDATLKPVQLAMAIASGVALTYKKEQDRLAKEERDRIDAERRKAEEDRRMAMAEELEAAGETEQADAVLSTPTPTPRPTKFVSPAPRVAGLSTRKKWKARISQPSEVARHLCLPDQSLCNTEVQSFFAYNATAEVQYRMHLANPDKSPMPEGVKKLLERMGGVEIYEEETFAGKVAR